MAYITESLIRRNLFGGRNLSNCWMIVYALSLRVEMTLLVHLGKVMSQNVIHLLPYRHHCWLPSTRFTKRNGVFGRYKKWQRRPSRHIGEMVSFNIEVMPVNRGLFAWRSLLISSWTDLYLLHLFFIHLLDTWPQASLLDRNLSEGDLSLKAKLLFCQSRSPRSPPPPHCLPDLYLCIRISS